MSHEQRKLHTEKELRDLPWGSVVVNGPRIGEEWVFRKNFIGCWILYDLFNDNTLPHEKIAERHPEWQAENGFPSLNLPVYVLSRENNRREALDKLHHWRLNKGWLTS